MATACLQFCVGGADAFFLIRLSSQIGQRLSHKADDGVQFQHDLVDSLSTGHEFDSVSPLHRKGVSMDMARNSLSAFTVSVAIFFTLANSVLADGVIRDGVGAISGGRGGTNLGFADNGAIILDNPGALVNICGNGWAELGADALFTDLTYTDPDNPRVDASDNPFPMGQLSLIRKMPSGNVAFGLGAFSVAGFSPKYTLNGPFPLLGPQTYKSVGAMMRVLPSVSLALTSRWSVGATLGVAISHTELEGPYFTQLATPFQGTPTFLDLQGTGAGLSWSVGTQYKLTEMTTFGMLFQGETQIDADGSARLTIPGLGTSRFDMDLETQWPSTLGIGIAHRLCPCTVVAADVLWTRWSGAKYGYNMFLSNASNPAFTALLGPRFPERFPMEWDDSVAVRLGFQRRFCSGSVFRTGYVYHPNPIPNATLTPWIQAIVEHTVSVGYGWKKGKYLIDVGYQYMFGPDEYVGPSGFIGGDFDNSRTTAGAHWLLTSVSRRF